MEDKQKYINKYKTIINFLINKSFPILKNKKIDIYEKKDLIFSADTYKLFSNMGIRTNLRLRKYNKNKLIGIFSHELSHLERWEKNKFYYYFIRDFKALARNPTLLRGG